MKNERFLLRGACHGYSLLLLMCLLPNWLKPCLWFIKKIETMQPGIRARTTGCINRGNAQLRPQLYVQQRTDILKLVDDGCRRRTRKEQTDSLVIIYIQHQ